MTRDELIERLKKSIAGKGKPESDYGEGWVDGMNVALRHVEKLDPPPAMAWQDEPSEKGWHWVEGCVGPRFVWYLGDGDWVASSEGENDDGLVIDGRRVCPIPAPPALPKRGAIDLVKHCEDAAKIVATWPAWKRGVLGHSAEPMNSTPREPVDNSASSTERDES